MTPLLKTLSKALMILACIALGDIVMPSIHPVFKDAHAQNRPIPRMVSLRAEEVNVRSGPGVRYPVKWVYQRKNMPVEVIAEYDTWRKIRDWEGTEGWVHQAMLSAKRTIVVLDEETTIRRQNSENSPATARLAQGMVGVIEECDPTWCLISVRSYDGWLQRRDIWGLYDGETLK